MPSFTFARGNATTILSLPAYAFGRVASMFVPRHDGLWVFGCGSGLAEGALELYRFARDADPSLNLLWLARDRRELDAARAMGLRAILRSSWRGFRATLRARVIVVTHGLGDANRFGTHGGFVVQLWHGIPLKRIQLDSPVTFRSRFAPARMLKAMYRRRAGTIRFMPAAGEPSASRLRSAFGLPTERVTVTGDPRDDVLFRGDEPARAILTEKLGDLGGAGVILHAPTWRDGDIDPAIPGESEWRLLADYLDSSDSVLVLRPHPHSVGDYSSGPAASPRIRMLTAAAQNDLNAVLPAIDLLVTDYSSVAYDFALTGRAIAFLAPDLEDYAASRGLYEPYSVFSGGSEVRSWTELLALLADPNAVERLAQHSSSLATTHHAYRDGRNTERVYEEILTRLRGQA